MMENVYAWLKQMRAADEKRDSNRFQQIVP